MEDRTSEPQLRSDKRHPKNTPDSRNVDAHLLPISAVDKNHVSFLDLPNEILVEILFLSVPRHDNYLDQLTTLSLVCRHTRGLIESTPSLHSYINTSFNYGSFSREVALSASAPLDVVVYRDQEDCKLDAIADTVQRWRSADIRPPLGSPSAGIQKLIQQPAPMLRKLGLVSVGNRNFVPNVFGGLLPELTVMQALACRLHWRSFELPNLRDLDIQRPLGLTEGTLRSILATCPELNRLSVRNWTRFIEEPDRDLIGSAPPPEIIHLPSLTELSLESIWGEVAIRLIPRLAVPRLQYLEASILCIPSDRHSYDSTIRSLLRLARTTKPFESWQQLGLSLTLGARIITSSIRSDSGFLPPGRSQRITISRTPTSFAWPPLLQAVDEIFTGLPLELELSPYLRLEGEGDPIEESLWRAEGVRAVTIRDGQDDRAASVFDMLKTPRLCERGIYRWVFPRLSSLTIYGLQSGEMVLGMVEGRYGQAQGLPLDANVERPAPLSKLYMPGLGKDGDLERIIIIHGEEVVQV